MKELIYRRLATVLGSRKFFAGILVLFAVETAWVALSGRYPMAYDEDFHLGIIRLYAHQWSPFFASQPAGANAFGAVARDPSYLYHWLMSFPYRLVDGLSHHSEYGDVITLRGFSILFAGIGIVLFRKVLLKAKASPAMVHTALLFFILTPLTPFVAAQINYDNLLFPMAALDFLLAVDCFQALRQGKVQSVQLLVLVGLLMLSSLVQYSFLPVLLALFVFMIGLLWRRRKRHSLKSLWTNAQQSFIRASWLVRIAAVGLFVVGLGLFTAMYGYNTVKYHTPVPQCDQVMGVKPCKAYGAWNRNYIYKQQNVSVSANPLTFSLHWANTYAVSSFFAVNGIYSGFVVGQPLPVLHIASFVVFWLFVLLLFLYWKKFFANPAYQLFGIVTIIYIATLWVQNYSQFVDFGQHVAEQGRYLWFVLPLVYMMFVQLMRYVLTRWLMWWTVPAFVVVLLVFMQGGGPLTYVARSDPSWWWQGQPTLIRFNRDAQHVVSFWTLGN